MLFYIDFKHDVPERFKISGFDVYLFKVTDRKDNDKCFVLKDSINKIDSIGFSSYVLGIRFKLEYFSLKREHLWDDERFSLGAMGHIDSISEINIYDSDNKKINNDYLGDAFMYKYFKKSNLDTWDGNHVNLNGCFEAQTYSSISDFIKKYNMNNDTVTFNINDCLLFKVSDLIVNNLVGGKAKLVLKFSKGRNIEGYVN